MPDEKTTSRSDILSWASQGGWTHESADLDDGQVVRDIFTREGLVLRTLWFSPAGGDHVFARGLLQAPKRTAQVGRLTGDTKRPTMESVLRRTHPLAK